MFLVTVLFLNTAKTKQELDSAVFQTAGIAQKFNCTLNRLDYLQEQGLMSSLPLANNLVPIKRALTTTSTAIFVPFTTQELFMEGDSLYYGLNAVSNNMIMADRKQLKNPNGLILGTPGSGKSFSAKREITNVFFTTTDDIIVADPEGEYYPLVEALGGQVIHISSTSKDYINPMDINLNYADDDNPLGMKSDFILSLQGLGYNKVITYILDTENGSSLKAVGYTCEGKAGGLEWNGTKAPKQADQYPRQMKTRWVKKKEGLHGS